MPSHVPASLIRMRERSTPAALARVRVTVTVSTVSPNPNRNRNRNCNRNPSRNSNASPNPNAHPSPNQALAHAKAGAEAAKAVAAQAVAEATAVKEASKREAANTKRRMDRQTERASQSQGLMKPLSARAGAKETAAPPTARAASAGRVGALSAEVAAEIEGRIGDAISAVLFRSRKAASAAEILSAVATIIQSPAPAAVGDTELGSAPPPPQQQQQPPPPP